MDGFVLPPPPSPEATYNDSQPVGPVLVTDLIPLSAQPNSSSLATKSPNRPVVPPRDPSTHLSSPVSRNTGSRPCSNGQPINFLNEVQLRNTRSSSCMNQCMLFASEPQLKSPGTPSAPSISPQLSNVQQLSNNLSASAAVMSSTIPRHSISSARSDGRSNFWSDESTQPQSPIEKVTTTQPPVKDICNPLTSDDPFSPRNPIPNRPLSLAENPSNPPTHAPKPHGHGTADLHEDLCISLQSLKLDASTLDVFTQYNITSPSQIPGFHPVPSGIPTWMVHKRSQANRDAAKVYAEDLRKWGSVPKWKRAVLEKRLTQETNVPLTSPTIARESSKDDSSSELILKLQRRREEVDSSSLS